MKTKLFCAKGKHAFVILSLLVFLLLVVSDSLFVKNGRLVQTANFNQQLPEKYRKSKLKSGKRPSDWGWMQRVFPYGNADKLAHVDAIQQAQSMRTAIRDAAKSSLKSDGMPEKALNSIEWQFAGPENIGGRISDIEYNPLDPSIVYAGAATGGVFKSNDGGWTWQPIFDDQAVLSVGDIAVDPVNPDIIYVGTGEANGGHNNFPGGGVYKSFDAGQSWQLIGLEKTVSIGRIIIDPSNPQRVFVAAIGSYFGPDPDRGVYRSIDGGSNWEKSLFVSDSTGAIDIVINPQNPSILLAAMWERVRRVHSSHLYGPTSGIYRSTDGGNSWNRLDASNGLPDGEFYIGRIGLALCESQPDVIYALYTDGYEYKTSYRSLNGGLNWDRIDPYSEIAGGTSSFSWYFGNIRVHPRKPNQVYALDVAFMRSTNGGNSWPLIYGYGNPFYDFHVDHHALAFHPQHPDTMIEGNDGGINISYDGGSSWAKVDLLPVTQFYEITMDQTNPERLYGGTQDNGTLRTLTGQVNDWDQIWGGDGFFVLVDPTNPNIIYAESQWGNLVKSANGGYYFASALNGINQSEPTNWSTPVVMDPNNHNVLYYGTNRVYRTTNAAGWWSSISPILTKQLENSGLGTVTTIAVAPSNSSVIYAGTDDGNVWVSDDGCSSWQDITAGLPYRWVTRVAVDPTNPSIAYVTFSGLKWKSPQPHVFRTETMGQSWQDISGNLPDAPVNVILVDPAAPNYLYIGSDVGCFFSANSGQHWDVLGQGLPVVPVYSMDMHKTLRQLAVGTYGRSMYRIDLEALDTKSITRQFESGWNLFSINVAPEDLQMTQVMQPVVDKLKLIKDNQGDVYVPQYGINTIGDIDLKQGYYGYFTEAVALNVTGQAIEAGTPIHLPAGWNTIGYLPDAPMAIEAALASISGALVLAKNGAGATYFPGYGINQIGQMQPGDGYQVYLNAACTLIYPSAGSGQAGLNKQENAMLVADRHFRPISKTAENATVVIPRSIEPAFAENLPLARGDEIGIFTPGGLCCGAAVWDGSNTSITIWGDDPQTPLTDGFLSDDRLEIRIWHKSDHREYTASVAFKEGTDSRYQPNGISVLTELRAEQVFSGISGDPEATLPGSFELYQNYPNPFNSRTIITYDIKLKTRISITIYNQAGQIVQTLVNVEQQPGRYAVVWDGSNISGQSAASGIYFYRIETPYFTCTKRLIFLK
ncbi:T9SS type A sorting domain-containing protein [candidate division KSB1 bacterium]|nr:T9SS type A sorting domain-containing protein [candidate division KSB1 bacterium]